MVKVIEKVSRLKTKSLVGIVIFNKCQDISRIVDFAGIQV